MEPAADDAVLSDLALLTEPASALPPLLAAAVLAWAFFVGACVGSFLNVVIARVPAGLSVVSPRSRCPKCEAGIGWYDNIPLLSWVLLRARCRSCGTPISARYPFVELLLALAGAAVAARYGLSLDGLEIFAFIAILVAVAFIDIDTWTIPYSMVASLLVVGFGGAVARGAAGALLGAPAVVGLDGVAPGPWQPLVDRAIGAIGSLVLLGAVVVIATWYFRVRKRIGPDETAMGWGDPLLLAGIGAVIGWQPMPLVVFLASAQGAVVGIALRLAGRLEGGEPVSEDDDWVPPKSAVPFGPFLALGAIEAAFWGDAILDAFRAWSGLA